MGQIVRRKKKGRPTKADLEAEKKKQKKKAAAAAESELRRSGRRRNVRYTFDFDDYLFDDEDDEDERRREKKLKLLLKLHSSSDAAAADDSPHAPPPTSAPSSPSSSSSSSADDDDKPSKKRKIDAGSNDDEVDYENDDDNNADYSQDVDNVEVKRRKKGEAAKDPDSAPGTPSEPPSETPSGFPLPEKKTLELILDKLQKKDIYGVYAEPVDPEELPDYHDVIKHPMDFSTIRSKLAKGSYANLEQFESDVFLICSNAMQYNAPDTIYYKQARNIQELAKKKFEKIRIKNERSDRELMLDQKPQSTSILKKQIRKPLSRRVQENVASDFSSGTTLATAGDIQNAALASGTERPACLDGLAEGSPYVIDTSLDKIEEVLPGKGPLSRFGRKLAVHDENRATYNISTEPVASSESIFSTFDGEIKQLIPVGLYVDHSYVRSLARFAGTLGPIAWRVASKRIEQVLPPGTKFGHGWVGEYEPPPTPVVMLENCTIKEPAFFMKPAQTVDTRKDEKHTPQVASSDSSIPGPTLEGKLPFFSPPGTKVITSSSTTTPLIAKEPPVRGTNSRGKQSFLCSPRTTITGSASSHLQHENSQTRHVTDSEAKVQKQVELNCPPTTIQSLPHVAVEGQVSNGTEVLAPRSVEMVSVNKNLLPSGSFKQPNTSGVAMAALPNEKMVTNNLDGSRVPVSSSDMGKLPIYSPRGQVQGLTDPVELMRMLNEKNQNQQKFATQSAVNGPPVPSPAQSLSREDSGNAAASAARAWMSIGAGGFRPAGGNMSPHKSQISADSLYNSTRGQLLQMSHFRGDSPAPALHFQAERNGFPFHGFVPEPARVGNTAQFQNRPMVFPQLLPADLSRFQMHPWRSLSPQTQQGQKQETVPPDLNVSFPSSGSPGRPSSGILVDSQQPDLALQL